MMNKMMIDVFSRAARDLFRPGILWHALWPPLLASIVWIYIAVAVWAHGVALIAGFLPQWDSAAWVWVTHAAAVFLLVAMFASLVYFTSLFLVAVFSLPRIMTIVARRDYPDVQRRGQYAFSGSIINTLFVGALFLLGSLVTLPLLLIPGAILVLPVIWTTWLNQRTFSFDALVEFAQRNELQEITQQQRQTLYLAGLGSALTAYVPLVHFLAPAFTALVYTHLCLTLLRDLRAQRGIVISITPETAANAN